MPVSEIPIGLGRRAVGRQAAVLPALDDRQHRARRPFAVVEAVVRHDLLEQALLVVGIDDGEVRPQAAAFSVAAQDARRYRVKVPRCQPSTERPTSASTRSFISLAAPVGEGDREELPRMREPGGQEVREPRGEHASLSRPRAGKNQHRAFGRLHRLALLGIERVEIACAGGVARRNGRDGRASARPLYPPSPALRHVWPRVSACWRSRARFVRCERVLAAHDPDKPRAGGRRPEGRRRRRRSGPARGRASRRFECGRRRLPSDIAQRRAALAGQCGVVQLHQPPRRRRGALANRARKAPPAARRARVRALPRAASLRPPRRTRSSSLRP